MKAIPYRHGLMQPMPNSHRRLAAVDLGSNSFRLEIGRVEQGRFYRTVYLKEAVRQGNGLDDNRNLTIQAMQRGWDCLARFGERLTGFDAVDIRAVATQTLREACNREEFLARGQELLGFPIAVVSGREEARLIYQGVAQTMPDGQERRLVIDIGGRSTELILGQGFVPTQMASYQIGSVSWSARFFPDNRFCRSAFQQAETAAKAVLEEALNHYRRNSWDIAYGSAGTIGAVSDILSAAGAPADCVTRDGLDWVQDQLLRAKNVDQLILAGLKDDRRALIAGGLSILRATFDLLEIDQMQLANGGLRHGLLGDLMGNMENSIDLPATSVQRLSDKFGVDTEQAARVAQVAQFLLAQICPSPATPEEPVVDQFDARSLREMAWAAQLHEVGSHISHSDAHKHGAYIINNCDAIGFTLPELHSLSLLVLGHRGKLRKLIGPLQDASFACQLLALRLAVILCHARREPDLQGLILAPDTHAPQSFVLGYRPGWAKTFPQSAHLLREEALAWQQTPWSLTVNEFNIAPPSFTHLPLSLEHDGFAVARY